MTEAKHRSHEHDIELVEVAEDPDEAQIESRLARFIALICTVQEGMTSGGHIPTTI
jgi:hypothetical protein